MSCWERIALIRSAQIINSTRPENHRYDREDKDVVLRQSPGRMYRDEGSGVLSFSPSSLLYAIDRDGASLSWFVVLVASPAASTGQGVPHVWSGGGGGGASS